MSLVALGEGYHNYHHAFPWDYKAGEFKHINFTTGLLDYFAKYGWVYDRKTASKELIKQRKKKVTDISEQLEHEF